MHWFANFHDHELKTVKAAIEVNENQKLKLIKKAKKYYESFDGLTVAVLGLTFKPDTDDLREAPSLVNIPILLDDGAKVKAYDPIGVENFKKYGFSDVTYYTTIDETIQEADLCFIFTEWESIKKYNIEGYTRLMKTPIVIDGRNCYQIEDVAKSGMVYESVGRMVVNGR